MLLKEFVCLANSRKHGGRCVAGILTDGSGWIRPISNTVDGALDPPAYWLEDGSEVGLLDIVEVEVSQPRPEPHQPENWILASARMKLNGRLSLSQALPFLPRHVVGSPFLFGTPGDSIAFNNLQERTAPNSLMLVEPANVTWVIGESSRGNRQARASFWMSGEFYNLVITDPQWEGRLSGFAQGPYPRNTAVGPRDRVLFTVSLGEPTSFDGRCYKLIAAVIVLSQEAHYNHLIEVRGKHPRAYEKWTQEEERLLMTEFDKGLTIAEIAARLGRKPGGIRSRLLRLGLLGNRE